MGNFRKAPRPFEYVDPGSIGSRSDGGWTIVREELVGTRWTPRRAGFGGNVLVGGSRRDPT